MMYNFVENRLLKGIKNDNQNREKLPFQFLTPQTCESNNFNFILLIYIKRAFE